MGLNDIPAVDARKSAAAMRAGKIVMRLVTEDLRPSKILTRAAFENAITAVATTAGSTNAVLHLMALAKEANVPLTLEDFLLHGDWLLRRLPYRPSRAISTAPGVFAWWPSACSRPGCCKRA